MKKRGISPLIASVLLIVFVIILFVLVSSWVRRSTLDPTMRAGEEKLASTLDCINAEIEIISVCVDSANIKIAVDNSNVELYGIKVRTISGDTVSNFVDIKPITPPVMPYNRLSGTETIEDIGLVIGVEVYPILKDERVCEAQKTTSSFVEYKETGSC